LSRIDTKTTSEPSQVGTPEAAPSPPEAGADGAPEERRDYWRFALLVAAGWLFTNTGYQLADQPHQALLKEQLGMSQEASAVYFFIAHFTNYIKPLAGVLIDAVPLFGARRRPYLILGLLACGIGWLILGYVPRNYYSLLITYTTLYVMVVVISTTLGGLMVEGGALFRASGRLSAYRQAIVRVSMIIGSQAGGWLATRDFALTTSLTAWCHFLLLPLFWFALRERPIPRQSGSTLPAVKEQFATLLRSRVLWAAAGLIFLVEVAPGFNTPLYYYQRDTLHFSQQFIGFLRSVSGACGVVGALGFALICRKVSLKPLLTAGILIHCGAALLFLWYRTPTSAVIIQGLYEAANTLAILPLYDLAVRGTPRGSEAMGYAVMMSVWNLTQGAANVLGARLVTRHGVEFSELIWINAGTTALVLFAIPFLPRVLVARKDGEACAVPDSSRGAD
jgi:predicted MFS family arabinose efflux permease